MKQERIWGVGQAILLQSLVSGVSIMGHTVSKTVLKAQVILYSKIETLL
jgi:hypothetical protein